MDTNPKPYQWDFAGACAPTNPGEGWGTHWETFTLGIFQWVPKSGGKGLKRSKVTKRVKGITSQPAEAYEKARAIVDGLNKTEPKR